MEKFTWKKADANKVATYHTSTPTRYGDTYGYWVSQCSTESRREQRRMARTDAVKSWRSESEGSAEIYSACFSDILDSYEEYRQNDLDFAY